MSSNADISFGVLPICVSITSISTAKPSFLTQDYEASYPGFLSCGLECTSHILWIWQICLHLPFFCLVFWTSLLLFWGHLVLTPKNVSTPKRVSAQIIWAFQPNGSFCSFNCCAWNWLSNTCAWSCVRSAGSRSCFYAAAILHLKSSDCSSEAWSSCLVINVSFGYFYTT